MKTEYSCGIVIFFKNSEWKPEFLIINQKSENWSFRWFPKWHIEPWETELQAAKREIWEEVWIKEIEIIWEKTFTTTYSFKVRDETINKNVTLFVWEVKNKSIKIQESELNGYKRAEFDVAMNILTHQNYKSILENVKFYLWC